MKKNAKPALALALAIAGAFAAPLCSDAAIDSIAPTTVQSVVASNEARAEKGLAFVLDVLAGWRGESAFASAEVQDHGEGAAGDCEWVGYSTTLYSTKGVRPYGVPIVRDSMMRLSLPEEKIEKDINRM